MADHLLPPNATDQDNAIAQACAPLGAVPSPLRDLWNPDTCPSPLLPWLAWSLGVEDWSNNWTDAVKRAVIKSSIPLRRIRGTRKAVEDVVRAYGSTLVLKEWWETTPQGTPHTFTVVIGYGMGMGTITAAFQADIVRAITRAKPLRSHFTVGVGLNFDAQLNVCGYVRAATFNRLQLEG
jgi:phage tail P2-like protein